MLKTLGAQVKEFKKASIATPLFMILEVIMEMIIPLMMASIIDDGVEKGDLHLIYVVGAFMVTSVVRRVSRPAVLNLSIFENEYS